MGAGMSRLFSHLAARARGAAVLVRPRLPSLFEPAGFSAAADPEVFSFESEAPASAARPASSVDLAPQVEPKREEAEPLPTPSGQPPAAVSSEAPSARSPLPPISATSPPAPTPPNPRPSEQAALEPKRGPARETQGDRPGAVQPSSLPQSVSPPSAPTAPTEPPSPTPAATFIRAQFPLRADAPRPPAIKPARDATRTRDAAHSAAPIQVTIGRIEVLAEAPTSPAPRRGAAPSPVMSLDDYLRSRSARRP
jgi:hypothetical protein